MTLSNLQVLRDLDTTQQTFDVKNQKLETKKRRSSCKNFLSYVVHILTFTLVSRNSRLDKVSKQIFEEIQARITHQISPEEKELFVDALKNAILVMKTNGGSRCKEGKTLLASVEKIQILQKKSSSKPSPSLSSSTAKCSDHPFIEKMKANPPQANGGPDLFFEKLVDELLEGTCFDRSQLYNISIAYKNKDLKDDLTKIAPYVFTQGSHERMKIFAKKIDATCLTPYITLIPDSILKELDGDKLVKLADEIIENSSPNVVTLKAIAEAFSPDYVVDQQDKLVALSYTHARLRWKILLPFCDQEVQVRLITVFLHDYPHCRQLFEVINSLEPNVWEIASQNLVLKYAQDFDILPVSLLASVLSGQKNNAPFCKSFFGGEHTQSYFEKQPLDKQLEFIEHIKLEVFESYFNEDRVTEQTLLTQLLHPLAIHPNQEHAQKILEILIRSLFKTSFDLLSDYDYFQLITHNCALEQLKKLPIKQYTPEIRIWLACVTGQLDDAIFKENAPLLDFHAGRHLLYSIYQCGLLDKKNIYRDLLRRTKDENMFNLAHGFYKSKYLPKGLFQDLRSWLLTLQSLPPELTKTIEKIPYWQQG